MSLQTTCYNILASYKDAQSHHKTSKYFDVILVTVIVINIATMMLSTVPGTSSQWGTELHIIEVVSVVLFTLEYILRIWSSAAAPPLALASSKDVQLHTPWQKRWYYLKSPMALIDLLAILPFYLSMFVTLDLRILRVFRVLRILKLGRYSRSMQTLITV
ncbi:ion transporter, partial [uncultured Alteromonas sp.]